MKSITRARALELAMDAINFEMAQYLMDAQMIASNDKYGDYIHKRADHYAELAAALNFIENLARQKELL